LQQKGVDGSLDYGWDGAWAVAYGFGYEDGTGLPENETGAWGVVSFDRTYEYDPSSLALSKVTDS
jgi:hypothetical protein